MLRVSCQTWHDGVHGRDLVHGAIGEAGLDVTDLMTHIALRCLGQGREKHRVDTAGAVLTVFPVLGAVLTGVLGRKHRSVLAVVSSIRYQNEMFPPELQHRQTQHRSVQCAAEAPETAYPLVTAGLKSPVFQA